MRRNQVCGWLSLLLTLPAINGVNAEQVRYYEQGGITYREARDTVRKPVREFEYKNQQQTYYREQYTTSFQDYQQLQYQPVTQYQWQPRWHGWWRVFRGPELAYHLVPQTTWQTKSQTYRYPVTTRQLVPDTQTVQVAMPKLAFKEEEVVTRTAVAPGARSTLAASRVPPVPTRLATPAGTYLPPAVAYVPPATPYTAGTFVNSYDNSQYGGVARLEGDPPRYSTAISGAPLMR